MSDVFSATSLPADSPVDMMATQEPLLINDSKLNKNQETHHQLIKKEPKKADILNKEKENECFLLFNLDL